MPLLLYYCYLRWYTSSAPAGCIIVTCVGARLVPLLLHYCYLWWCTSSAPAAALLLPVMVRVSDPRVQQVSVHAQLQGRLAALANTKVMHGSSLQYKGAPHE